MNFIKVTLGSQVRVVPFDQAMEVADQLFQELKTGIPTFHPCDEHGNDLTVSTPPPVLPSTTPPPDTSPSPVSSASPSQFSSWTNTVIDEKARDRINEQHRKLKEAGVNIDPSQQFFATGTRMAAEGYATQEKRFRDHQGKMPLKDAIAALASTVLEESRKDIHLDAKEIAQAINVSNNEFTIGSLRVGEHALRGLTSRLASPVTAYALGLQERSASGSSSSVQKNDDLVMMAEVLRYECLRNPGVEFKLRTREARNDIYAILSPTFGVADAPAVMDQILDAMPTDAKGTWSYNPETTRWELRAEIWTPTPVAEHSVGEVISSFVSMSSRDNGTGRFKGGGGIVCLRCLNASTYSAGETMSRVHRGNRIMFDISGMIQKANKAIDTLCLAWGRARQEEIPVPTGLTLEQAIPGLYMHLLQARDSDLVGILPGRKENNAKALSRHYFEQRRDTEKLVKSDVVQGWTSFIKTQSTDVQLDAEEAAGAFMVHKQKFDFQFKD